MTDTRRRDGDPRAVTSTGEAPGARLTGLRRAGRAAAASPVARQLAVLAGYLAAGIAVTWPRATWLAEGRLPATRDGGSYVWGFWWMAHQVTHLGDPWFTRSIAAPAGTELGYHALMPLEGLVLAPVTLAFGPALSYNVLSVLCRGCCAMPMYRAARLWLRTQAGAIAAGGFFGLSSMLTWLAWYQLNLAAGVLFLPLALEAAVRLRRRPGPRQAVILGLVLAASLLTDQETAVLAGILVVLVLVPWLAGRPAAGTPGRAGKLAAAAGAVAVALVVASPQIVAMVVQSRSGGTSFPPREVVENYVSYNPSLSGMFGVSPRVLQFGLGALKPVSYRGPITDGIPAFGLVLSVLAVAGLIVSRRRRSAWLLALLWAGAAALALGSTLKIGTRVYVPAAQSWHGVRVSAVLPYTWFVRIPGLAGFREAARITLLALVPAALLAGAAVRQALGPRPRAARAAADRGPGRGRWLATRPSPPCPPRCPRSTPPSPPTTRPPSSSTSRSASAAASRCPARAPRSTPKPRYWPPPTATPAPSATCPGSRPPPWPPSARTPSTPGCWPPRPARPGAQPGNSPAPPATPPCSPPPAATPAPCTSAGYCSGSTPPPSPATSPAPASAPTTPPTGYSYTGPQGPWAAEESPSWITPRLRLGPDSRQASPPEPAGPGPAGGATTFARQDGARTHTAEEAAGVPDLVIGLLHPGEMGAAVGGCLVEAGYTVWWASEGRGPDTASRARRAGLSDAGRIAALAARTDVIVSVCPPHAAVEVARAVAAGDPPTACRGRRIPWRVR